MLIEPYLNFGGNCREAIEFYQKTFGGEILSMITFGETPAAGDVPAGMADAIMHTTLKIGDQMIMASDAPHDMYRKPQGMFLSIGLKDPAEAERIFNALGEGGDVQMPMEKTFWAERFGMLVDRFGTPWMVNCDLVEQPA